MKKYLIVLFMLFIFVIGLAACGVVDEVPTVPMATITPSPSAVPSSMPSLIPTVENTSDIIPQTSDTATAGATSTSQAQSTNEARR